MWTRKESYKLLLHSDTNTESEESAQLTGLRLYQLFRQQESREEF